MTRTPPDTPFTVTLDDLPVCGVSDRLQRRIQLQFAGVLMAVAVVVFALVKLLK